MLLFARTGGAQEVPASIAYPGSFWISAGDVVPAETIATLPVPL